METEVNRLVTRSQETFFGKYRGFVTDNEDPETRARIKLTVPSVLGEEITHWAEPCLPFGGLSDQGLFMVPEVGAQVWVEFEEGNVSKPIWTGTVWQQTADVPTEAADRSPHMRQLKTPSGHILSFDDTDGEEEIRLYHKADAEMKIDQEGSIQFTDASGATLTMNAEDSSIQIEDANGNTVVMESSGTTISDSNGNQIEMQGGGITVSSSATITIEGSMVNIGGSGGEPLIKGQSFLSLFATHIHTVAPVVGGPTSPPIPQGEMSTLSVTNKVT